MTSDRVSILEGNTFVVSDHRGDIEGGLGDEAGLFSRDTRYLSRWVLTLGGQRPNVLSVDDLHYFRVQFFMALSTGTIYVDSQLSVVRRRAVGNGFHEDITLQNHASKPVDIELRLEVAADFADLFEVKDKLVKKGELTCRVEPDKLVFAYSRGFFRRETWVTPSVPALITENALSFTVQLPAHGSWTTCIDVMAIEQPRANVSTESRAKYRHETELRPDLSVSLREWLEGAPRLVSSAKPLERTYTRSLADLAALRFHTRFFAGAMPAAGLPWFMTIFGRDSLITSYQALPFAPELANTTLRTLAVAQARVDDPFRDAEPGKILHELRLGELTAFEERPHSPYYGSADATPLFLVLLDEYERWTGDRELVKSLERSARAAIRWCDQYGDRDGDGYIEYERRNKATGLENQSWKDSWDSIAFADATIAPTPRATCEVQGYLYDAKVRTARLARVVWSDPAWAAQLEGEAEELKQRFNRDFWIPERRFFALALDGQKRKVDSLTSNIGHLLWSGIVADDKAADCAKHLLGAQLFSGWGVRTMAKGEGRYNPIGYHVGTVWPHDNSIIAWGLRRYGFRAEAARLAEAMLDAAVLFHHRLPEVFAGYERELTRFPVEYPTACSPQAWASGATLLLLRTLLGLNAEGEHLLVEPALPRSIERLELLDVPGRWGRADAFGRVHATNGGARAVDVFTPVW
jgi:glycogen debranching enzyme